MCFAGQSDKKENNKSFKNIYPKICGSICRPHLEHGGRGGGGI